ncbi:uncharacterized protein LOC122498061 [Leptopilina heterotoma]|uniref:uncharacterized protein LOC122498061 n=1 Tax=Leptopilina heterotoma TaxID=63436 RepID=UPI001CA846F2|nr:uncharacterized protein LOC122498061 [Leptopilina heterotoma]
MTMEIQLILLSLCVTLAASIDLGPYIRIAQCRSQCLRQYSVDGTCDVLSSSDEYLCRECWNHCEGLEYQWQTYKDLCENDAISSTCPSCGTICNYRKTRVIEEYLPSTLPAPERPPASLKKYDIAILLRKVNNEWIESGYFPGSFVARLKPSMWLIVVSGDGVRHFSYDEWIPTLESLKSGSLYEATISWRNVDAQIRKNYVLEQKEFNDKIRQFYLEKYGHSVLNERNSEEEGPTEALFRDFFFKKKNDEDIIFGDHVRPSTSYSLFNKEREEKKESWVVAWEPEAGGLTGNQEADSNYAQITLLPGTRYRVRIASKDGPGSFPIEVDTSASSFVQVHRIKKNFKNIYAWGIIAASMSMLIFITVFGLIKLLTRNRKYIETEEEVV